MSNNFKLSPRTPLLSTLLLLTILLLSAGTALAGYKQTFDGVQVTFSGSNCNAFVTNITGDDLTLVVEVFEDGGTLQIKAGKETINGPWGPFVDVVINAPFNSFKNLKIMGNPDSYIFVAGQTAYVSKFMMKYGCVGNTTARGFSEGLGGDPFQYPANINMKAAFATGSVLGESYPDYPLALIGPASVAASQAPATPVIRMTRQEKLELVQRLKQQFE